MHSAVKIRLRRNLRSLPIAAAACVMTGTACGEGAVKTLQCTVRTACNAAGACSDASGEVTFRLEPQQLVADGAGSYVITYASLRADEPAEVQAAMQADTEFGPYYWTHGSERHSLILSSETQWLWHSLTTEPAPQATIRFLECRLTS